MTKSWTILSILKSWPENTCHFNIWFNIGYHAKVNRKKCFSDNDWRRSILKIAGTNRKIEPPPPPLSSRFWANVKFLFFSVLWVKCHLMNHRWFYPVLTKLGTQRLEPSRSESGGIVSIRSPVKLSCLSVAFRCFSITLVFSRTFYRLMLLWSSWLFSQHIRI